MLRHEPNTAQPQGHVEPESYCDLGEDEGNREAIGGDPFSQQAELTGVHNSRHSRHTTDAQRTQSARSYPNIAAPDKPKYNITSAPKDISSPSPIRPGRRPQRVSVGDPPLPHSRDEHAESSSGARNRSHHQEKHKPRSVCIDTASPRTHIEVSTARGRDELSPRSLDRRRRLCSASSRPPILPELRDIEQAGSSSRARDSSRCQEESEGVGAGVVAKDEHQAIEVATPRIKPALSPNKPNSHHLRRISTHLPAKSELKDTTQAGSLSTAQAQSTQHGTEDPRSVSTAISEKSRGKASQIPPSNSPDRQLRGVSTHAPSTSGGRVAFFNYITTWARPREQMLEDPHGLVKLITVQKLDKSDRALLLPEVAYLQLRFVAGMRRDLADLEANYIAIASTIEDLEVEKGTVEPHEEMSIPGSFPDAEKEGEVEACRLLLSTLAKRISVNTTRLHDLDRQKREMKDNLDYLRAIFLRDLEDSLLDEHSAERMVAGLL